MADHVTSSPRFAAPDAPLSQREVDAVQTLRPKGADEVEDAPVRVAAVPEIPLPPLRLHCK